MTTNSFVLEPSNPLQRNLAWRLHFYWSDCITFDATDKATFAALVDGEPVEPFHVVRFLHHAMAKSATRKGQSMSRRSILEPLQQIADLLEPQLRELMGSRANSGTLDGIEESTSAMPVQVALDVKILRAESAFLDGMLSIAQQQRIADFRAGVAAATHG